MTTLQERLDECKENLSQLSVDAEQDYPEATAVLQTVLDSLTEISFGDDLDDLDNDDDIVTIDDDLYEEPESEEEQEDNVDL